MSTTSSLEVRSPHVSLAYISHQQPRGRRLPSQLHISPTPLSLFSATARLHLDCSHPFGECIRDTPPPPEVAIAYALGGGSGGLRGRRALLFKLRANSFIDRGADLSYCSCFAAEAEAHLSPYLPISPHSFAAEAEARACVPRTPLLCTRGTRQHTRSTHSSSLYSRLPPPCSTRAHRARLLGATEGTGRKAQRRWRHSPRFRHESKTRAHHVRRSTP